MTLAGRAHQEVAGVGHNRFEGPLQCPQLIAADTRRQLQTQDADGCKPWQCQIRQGIM